MLNISILKQNITVLLAIIICGLSASCAKEVKADLVVYENNFESGDFAKIDSGTLTNFNGSKVLGRYNNGGFTVQLDGLPGHELVEISFDLYIHDSWEGNLGSGNTDGPDMWYMKVDDENIIATTFSNTDCQWRVECNPQSYPFNYPNNKNNPRTEAFNPNLPGACLFSTWDKGTTQYKIIKRIRHQNGTLIFGCFDKLVQTNAVDKLCNESWSVDNIKIRLINL